MQTALKLQTTILPGGRIEVTTPEFVEGQTVELIILTRNPKYRGCN